MTTTERPKFDIYQKVTDSIVAALEKGVRPWTRPWAAPDHPMGVLPLRHNGTPYQGINVWLLWAAAADKGYLNPRWMTFNQAKGLGGMVRKGEKSTMVVFYMPLTKTEKNAKGESVEKKIPLLRAYNVFNIEQIDGLPERFYLKAEPVAEPTPAQRLERIARCETYFAAAKSEVRHGGFRAFYSMSDDHIQMPEFAGFKDAESYYATLAHEHIHWTGAKARLDREFGKRFGDKAYAAEELVAEMGSAFVCATLGLMLLPREDHASYLQHWITVLKSDKRAIFTASSAAQRAVEYLNKLAGVVVANDDEAEEMKEAA